MGNSVGVRPDPGECPRFPLRDLLRVEKINSLCLKGGNNRLGIDAAMRETKRKHLGL